MQNTTFNDVNNRDADDQHHKNTAAQPNDQPTADKQAEIIIVSGRSGSGKTSVLNILEDFGYYAIDNMPLSLVPEAVKVLAEDRVTTKVALGVDVRTPQADLTKFSQIEDELVASYGSQNVQVLYVTAQESVLVARFDATRRIHPLMSTNDNPVKNLPHAIEKEIALLEPIASRANIKIDTSLLNIHQLKELVRDHLGMDNKVTINLLSFGFKYGIPIDADYVFDVRVLPNPHWQPSLRAKTGCDSEVAEFFAHYPEVDEMGRDIYQFLNRWLPDFLHNNRHTVTIGIGCTGGKHRSVYISEMLMTHLAGSLPEGLKVAVKHREKGRWVV